MANLKPAEIEYGASKQSVFLIDGTDFAVFKSKLSGIKEPWVLIYVPSKMNSGTSKTKEIAIARAQKMQSVMDRSSGQDAFVGKNKDQETVLTLRYYGQFWEPGKPDYEEYKKQHGR